MSSLTGEVRQNTREVRVAAYIRVSTDSSDQENSYELQKKYFLELFQRHKDWISVGIYSDYGISGTQEYNRAEYQKILKHCRDGKIDRIICKSISRFARNTVDFLSAMKLLRECGVSVLFEKEGIDSAEFSGDFILATLSAIAQEESRSISENCRWSIQKRFPKGQARNYKIYGYRFAEGDNSKELLAGVYELRKIEVNNNEAEIVKKIFHAVDNGNSFASVARMLNAECVNPPNFGKLHIQRAGRSTVKDGIEVGWTAAMISRIVSLERYCGDALLQKTYTPNFLTHISKKNNGEVPQYLVKNHHPAIIDRDIFERVQKIKAFNAVKYRNKSPIKKKHEFSGKIVCAECGRNYNVRNQKYNPIWYCPTAALNNGRVSCHGHYIYEETVTKILIKAYIKRFGTYKNDMISNIITVVENGLKTENCTLTSADCLEIDNLLKQIKNYGLSIFQGNDFICVLISKILIADIQKPIIYWVDDEKTEVDFQ